MVDRSDHSSNNGVSLPSSRLAGSYATVNQYAPGFTTGLRPAKDSQRDLNGTAGYLLVIGTLCPLLPN
ncbi:hypothetical protein EOD39_2811 [Acipenser ruthenus]|uniref:Uncharacterized protein n=1 Tax=Acipenser ruthenus TaxID=7906 RepID=A0A444TY92_ACIRT|nr:hypothetical protein EOD39_2811 [Acipenser ruthenus]